MRLKHWAYIGLVFVVGQDSLMAGVGAAELMPVPAAFRNVAPRYIRMPAKAFARRPPARNVRPVLVRLFADQQVSSLWINAETPISLSGKKLKGKFYVTVRGQKIYVFRGAHSVLKTSNLRIVVPEGKSFQVKTRLRGARWLSGPLRITLHRGYLKAVARVNIDDYAAGILEGELGSVHHPKEVLKAQYVVAQSYMLSMRTARHSGQGFEFCDQPHCQVFRGIAREQDYPGLAARLKEAEGQYVAYQGRAIPAFYHHNCGGMTSSIEDVWPAPGRPYLRPVVEPVQGVCRGSRRASWKVQLRTKKLNECFLDAGILKRKETITDIKITQIDAAGRAQRLAIFTPEKKDITVGRFRNIINTYFGTELLKSALFTIEGTDQSFHVQGRGWGHGVGFCQEGAIWMAKNGATYQQILQHYYPHTTIKTL